jgi:hypothetical protein
MTKLEKTVELIRAGLAVPNRSVLAWSGGKDSMVLLHILQSLGIKMPVIFFKEPWQPEKYTFQNEVTAKYNLEVYTWQPCHSAFQQNGDEFEVQNVYQLNESLMTCPTGITPPVEGKPWVCAIDILNRPKQINMTANWDMVWIGHKSCDSDPIYGGDAGTRITSRFGQNWVNLMFPLRDWSHDDIWEYIEANDVPWDKNRYEKVDGKYREKPDKSLNVDYVHACTACIDKRPTANKFVYCPKFKGIVENAAGRYPWADQTLPSYMKD